jgi:hypothetical protein
MNDMLREATVKGLFASSFGFFKSYTRGRYRGFARFATWVSMFWCVLRHGSSPAEYAYLGFDKKSDRERSDYFTMLRFERFIKKVNTGDKMIFMNKIRFNQRFSSYLHRDWLDVSQASFQEFSDFVRCHGEVMIKATELSCGKGISRYVYQPGDDLQALYDTNRDMLLEQVIHQHPDLAAYNPQSVNVPRLNTMLDEYGQPHVFSAFLRTGAGDAIVDNLGAGGMAAHIDPETGLVTTLAIDAALNEYICHPRTGKPFPGFQVPHWKEAVEMVTQAAREVPEMRYIGWDVAITQDGVCLIEGNDRADICVRQYVDRRGWYKTLKTMTKKGSRT